MALHEHGDFIKEKDKQMYSRLSVCILVISMYSLAIMGGEYYFYEGNQYTEQELYNRLEKDYAKKFNSYEVKNLERLERNSLEEKGVKGAMLEQEMAARIRIFRRNVLEEIFLAGLQNGKIIRSEAGRVESSTSSMLRQGSTQNQASTSARTNSTEYPSWSILLVIVAVIILGYAIYHHMAAEKESSLRARHRVRKNTRKQSDSEDEDEDEE